MRELASRGEVLGTSEAKQVLEYAIEVWRGGMYLRLTPGQYAAAAAVGRAAPLPSGVSALQLGITDRASLLVDTHSVIGCISLFKCSLLDGR
jgi:hypothetical protein